MEPSGHTPPDQKPRQTENSKQFSNQLSVSRTMGSRFFSCLVIAVAFILIDLAILFYFLWPLTPPKDVEQLSPRPAGIESEINKSVASEDQQQEQ